jgi:signal transduction histidine kinase/CheY-like chemotaxis protein
LLDGTHKQIRGLFGKNEERLADFISTIAGAALENADGFLKLQKLNSTLELRVAERTAAAENRAQELSISNRELERTAAELRSVEEQLRIAKDAAESASLAKSRFLATMSHEIRTPMNGVMGMTELALKTRLTSQQQNYLLVVKQSADALLRLLNDILDFSKIEAGKLELELMPFDVREVVGNAARILSVRASQNNLELMFEIDADVPARLVGDAGRLHQILVNLIGNAIKFTSQGDVHVRVQMVEQAEEGAVLRFAVHDTGIGIPPEQQARIFDSFSQADSSITRRFGGTGLGLAISAQLVELMQGRLAVDSVPNEGSTFHFTAHFGLPAEDAPDETQFPEAADVAVLVVDDHPISRRIVAEQLRQLGLRPQAVADARSGLDLLEQAAAAGDPCRLAVIDTVLSGEDGWWLAEQIRSSPALADCPIVFLTSAGRIEGAEDPFASYLTKPVKHSELASTIAEALGTVSAAEEAPVDESIPSRQTRILLVEDGEVNQEVAQGLLELQGYQVQIANNGCEALAALEESAFDIILMDLEMPEMDGMTATAEIRRREALAGSPRTPIVAMTAHGISSIRQQCLEIGMDGYLSKPIQPQELFDELDRMERLIPQAAAACV